MFNDYEIFMLSKIKQNEMWVKVKDNQHFLLKQKLKINPNIEAESKQIDVICCKAACC